MLENTEIPYYIVDEDGNTSSWDSKKEAYIDDDELKEMLLDYLGDNISENDLERILDAASNEDISEEEFDKLVDEFISNSKK